MPAFCDLVDLIYPHKEAVIGFTYLGEKMSTGGGCEAAVSTRTRFWWLYLGNY